jgi:hypothetical protein
MTIQVDLDSHFFLPNTSPNSENKIKPKTIAANTNSIVIPVIPQHLPDHAANCVSDRLLYGLFAAICDFGCIIVRTG